MSGEMTNDWLKQQKQEKETQKLINEIYATHPEVRRFMEIKEKTIETLMYTVLALHFLWYFSSIFLLFEYPGVLGSPFSINFWLLILCCAFYIRPNEKIKNTSTYHAHFYDVIMLNLSVRMLLFGGIVQVFLNKDTGFSDFLRQYQDMFFHRPWYSVLAVLLLLVYLLMFVAAILLSLPKSKLMMVKFLELLEKKEAGEGGQREG